MAALAQWLYADNILTRATDGEVRVTALESRYGISLPDDFRRYLLETAPSEDQMDPEGTAWRPPDRIKNIPDEYEHGVENLEIAAEANAYLFFADYLIWCWAWAICCSDGPNRGRVAFIGGDPDGFVADSFKEFVERYLRDPRRTANSVPDRGNRPAN